MSSHSSYVVAALILISFVPPPPARAHCDSLAGPVVAAAKQALAANDPTPVLMWVREAEEREVREAFASTVAVRGLNDQAKELADRFFFETVVRLHRLGEGEPYTGLKTEEAVAAAIERADTALLTGDLRALTDVVVKQATDGIATRFAEVREHQRHRADSVAAGRAYVAAYVEFIHYVERLDAAAAGEPGGEHL